MVNNVPHLYGDDTSYNILIKRLVYGDIEIFFNGTSTYTYTWTTTSGYSQLPTDVSIENDDLSTINIQIAATLNGNTLTANGLPPTHTNTLIYTSDLSFYEADIKVEIEVEKVYAHSISLTCCSPCTGTISHSLTPYDSSSVVPSWLSLDANNQILQMMPTGIKSDTTFYAYITTNYLSASYNRKVAISVIPCKVANCSKCSNLSLYSCVICSSGFQLNSDSTMCNIIKQSDTNANTNTNNDKTKSISDEPQTMQTVSQIVLTCAIFLSSFASLLSFSSPNGIWIIFNQFQLILLTPIVGVNLPVDVLQSIVGFEFSSFSLSFVPSTIGGVISVVNDRFKFSPIDSNYDLIGLSSSSTFYNFFRLILILIFTIIVHIIVQLIIYLLKKKLTSECANKTFQWILNIFNLSIYLRMFLESYLFLILSLASELKQFNTFSILEIVSIIISIVISLFIASISIFIAAYLFRDTNSNYFSELTAELKQTKLSRLYNCMFITRRLASVLLIVFIPISFIQVKSAMLCFVQLLVLVYNLIARPYDKLQNNLSEILNEIYFLTMTVILFSQSFSNSEWPNALEKSTLWLILSNSIMLLFIQVGVLIKSIVLKINSKCRSRRNSTAIIPIGDTSIVSMTRSVSSSVNEIELNQNRTSNYKQEHCIEEVKISSS